MAQTLVMPKLGLTMTEGTIAKWMKREGDAVSQGEGLYEVETDKLTNTIEATAEGVILKILVRAGETAACLAPVAVIGQPGEAVPAEYGATAAAVPTMAENGSAQGGGWAAPGSTGFGSARDPQEPPQDVPETAGGGEVSGDAGDGGAAACIAAGSPAGSAGRIVAAPAAKKLAAEKGVDLALVSGTGPNGRIAIADVEKYLKACPQPPAKVQAKSPAKASPLAEKLAAERGVDLAEVPRAPGGRIMAADVLAREGREAAFGQERQPASQAGSQSAFQDGSQPAYQAGSQSASQAGPQPEETVRMTAMRRVIAARMLESKQVSPTVSFDISVDMRAMKQVKAQLLAQGLKVSYTDLLVQFTAKTLMDFPALNCSVQGESITYKRYVNMGIAVALEEGLLVPVVRDAHRKGLKEISEEIRRLAEEAKEGGLSPDALKGGTFTITNLGMFGIESFSPIINQPEVAILGVNAMKDELRLEEGKVISVPVMKLSLTADHRVVDGAVAAGFLAGLKRILENPALALV